jgi:hypothetical protein
LIDLTFADLVGPVGIDEHSAADGNEVKVAALEKSSRWSSGAALLLYPMSVSMCSPVIPIEPTVIVGLPEAF